MEYYLEELSSKLIKVKKLCAKKLKTGLFSADTIKTNQISTERIDTNNIYLSGMNLGCFLKTPVLKNAVSEFDCMDCNITEEFPYGQPIKPDFLKQDVWDYLSCNREAYRKQLHDEFLQGREQIRCIKNAYGCVACPPDCLPVEGCTGPCPDPPNCTIDPSCIPDSKTCALDVPLYLYATQTVAPYFYTDCDNTSKGLLRFATSKNFSLNVNNISCTISPRVATVFLQYAYLKNGYTGTPGITGTNCASCSGTPSVPEQECNCPSWNGVEISCGMIDVICRQFEATININIGEKFDGSVSLNTLLIESIFLATKNLELGIGQFPAAIQLSIFLEDGLEIKNPLTRSSIDSAFFSRAHLFPSTESVASL